MGLGLGLGLVEAKFQNSAKKKPGGGTGHLLVAGGECVPSETSPDSPIELRLAPALSISGSVVAASGETLGQVWVHYAPTAVFDRAKHSAHMRQSSALVGKVESDI